MMMTSSTGVRLMIVGTLLWSDAVPAAAREQSGDTGTDYIAKANALYGLNQETRCRQAEASGNEVVICGRKGPSPHRLPLPAERTGPPPPSRDRADLAANAVRDKGKGCIGHDMTGCGAMMINPLSVGVFVVSKLLPAITGPDSREPDPTSPH